MMDDDTNPYRSPASREGARSPAIVIRWARVLICNALVYVASMLVLCIDDYLYVRHGQGGIAWSQLIVLPSLCAAVFWANRDLFRFYGDRGLVAVAILVVVLLQIYGTLIFLALMPFHLHVGGSL